MSTKMNPEIKQRWIGALRSGEYSQGRFQLHDYEHTFCCLGVLCDLYLKEHNDEWRDAAVGLDYIFPTANGGEGEVLTAEVAKWAGLDERNPRIGGERITNLNDYEKFTFNELAELIDSHL